jgi:hypothetical protein
VSSRGDFKSVRQARQLRRSRRAIFALVSAVAGLSCLLLPSAVRTAPDSYHVTITVAPRITSLNQLLVVAYSPRGTPAPSERLGVWITAVREGYGGDWRLLEATVTPP